MKNYLTKKLYRKMKKAELKSDLLEKVLHILEVHDPACAKKHIEQLFSMYNNKYDHHRLLLGYKTPDELEEEEYFVDGKPIDFAQLDRKREIDFTPSKDEFITTINLPIGELQKMGCNRITSPVTDSLPDNKIFLALPFEWRYSIPDGHELWDFDCVKRQFYFNEIDNLPVYMGCLTVGIVREPDGTEYIPTLNFPKPAE